MKSLQNQSMCPQIKLKFSNSKGKTGSKTLRNITDVEGCLPDEMPTVDCLHDGLPAKSHL